MKQLGKHDYSGNCAPTNKYCIWETFSVGIFEWIPAKFGLKKSKVKVRVSGSTYEPEEVYAKAEEICKQLDSGTYNGPKNVRARK
jgi:hypothetical protein